MVEAELGFLEEQREMGTWNTVVAPERALGLVPEVLYAIDVVVLVARERFSVVDPVVVELGHVETS